MEIEFLILADAADAVGGKLYMLGGGWDVLTVSTVPTQQPFAVGAGLIVPWNDTNEPHAIGVEIQTEDGEVISKMEGQLELGRPPGLPAGLSQRVVLAFRGVMGIQAAGNFVILARLDGKEAKRVGFRVVAS